MQVLEQLIFKFPICAGLTVFSAARGMRLVPVCYGGPIAAAVAAYFEKPGSQGSTP